MHSIELITIGREILDGRVVDTNSVFLGEELKRIGLTPRFAQRVDDEMDRIVESFQIAARRSQIVLVTGGLGPTSDDLTAEAFARFLGMPLIQNQTALKMIEDRFRFIQREMLPIQKKQANLPENAAILENKEGTAPGFAYTVQTDSREVQFFFMPGVPLEMKRMFLEEVVPELPRNLQMKSAVWMTHFTSEGGLGQKLIAVTEKLPSHFELTYRTRFPENHIGLYADCAHLQDEILFQELVVQVTEILGHDVYFHGISPEPVQSLEEVVLGALFKNGFVLGCAESCTGGLLAHRLTSISGSSKSFWGGVVCYENSIKSGLLSVSTETLKKHGAVSAQVATALAEGGLRLLTEAVSKNSAQADWALPPNPKRLLFVSTTGIAGPTGGSAEKPVGLCYIGLAATDKPTQVIEVRASRHLDRERNKLLFSQKALNLVRESMLS